MGWESSGMVGFDLGPLLEGQMRTAKLKSAYNLLIIGSRGFGALSLRWIQFASVFRCARSSLFLHHSSLLLPPHYGRVYALKENLKNSWKLKGILSRKCCSILSSSISIQGYILCNQIKFWCLPHLPVL